MNYSYQLGQLTGAFVGFIATMLFLFGKGRTRTQTVTWMTTHMNHGRPDAEFVRVATEGAKTCVPSLKSAAMQGP